MKLFIPSKLDDYKLTAYQFRLFCHIARREDCYEAVPKMAKHCGMKPRTAWQILKFLEAQKMIHRAKSPGFPTHFFVRDDTEWAPLPLEHPLSLGAVHPLSNGAVRTAARGTTKGIPVKAILIKGEAPPVEKLSAAERISYEKERERIKDRRNEIRNEAPHGAWGPEYTEFQKMELATLSNRDKVLAARLGCVV